MNREKVEANRRARDHERDQRKDGTGDDLHQREHPRRFPGDKEKLHRALRDEMQ
jgi:hypothetical protein